MAYWLNEPGYWLWLLPNDEFVKEVREIRKTLNEVFNQEINFPLHLTIGKIKEPDQNIICQLRSTNSNIKKGIDLQLKYRHQVDNYFNSATLVPRDINNLNNWLKSVDIYSNFNVQTINDPHVSLSYGFLGNNISQLTQDGFHIGTFQKFVIAFVNEKNSVWKVVHG